MKWHESSHIFGELYFSGHEGASTHIVDTGDGSCCSTAVRRRP
ncbi:MAG: hypothetical protein ACLR5G_10470 [Eubacteriales bacterium]